MAAPAPVEHGCGHVTGEPILRAHRGADRARVATASLNGDIPVVAPMTGPVGSGRADEAGGPSPPPLPWQVPVALAVVWLLGRFAALPGGGGAGTAEVLLVMVGVLAASELAAWLIARLRGTARPVRWQGLTVLAALFLLFWLIRLQYPFLVNPGADIDWLLASLWALMVGLVALDVDVRRDLPLLLVGLVGGFVIETWGTVIGLWHYFSGEAPPLWILPAWPVAALTVERMVRLTRGARWPGWSAWLSWPLMLSFIGVMGWFVRPTWGMGATQAVLAMLVLVTVLGARPRTDVPLFVVGAALGLFLEFWGTSRGTWTYWTAAVPPVAAVMAHGFASVAFARTLQWGAVVRAWSAKGLRRMSRSQTEAPVLG